MKRLIQLTLAGISLALIFFSIGTRSGIRSSEDRWHKDFAIAVIQFDDMVERTSAQTNVSMMRHELNSVWRKRLQFFQLTGFASERELRSLMLMAEYRILRDARARGEEPKLGEIQSALANYSFVTRKEWKGATNADSLISTLEPIHRLIYRSVQTHSK